MLIPINGTALVALHEQGAIQTPDKSYKTYHQGAVVRISHNEGLDYEHLVGKEVYFEEFKDSCQAELNGQNYAFITLTDLRGYDDEQAQ